ncbi:unnamed protein product [Ceratitis capitata]|uniref:(Mediterranean fruit fly) hypothetical protein n=1 Tax=Ceratitis capitata TaxID=7213 RepID=A0A811VEH3_CERCA|nr:unnamed protein product [Ceratitis capitata]
MFLRNIVFGYAKYLICSYLLYSLYVKVSAQRSLAVDVYSRRNAHTEHLLPNCSRLSLDGWLVCIFSCSLFLIVLDCFVSRLAKTMAMATA